MAAAPVHRYRYEPIIEPSFVRLLHLHPGAGLEPIEVSLKAASLNDNPEFEAISYCWGDPTGRHEISCDGGTQLITESLFSALSAFRHPTESRVLWADAICINQEDVGEKSSQVLMMPRIYSEASRVLIWLGPSEEGLEGLNDCVSEALHFFTGPLDAATGSEPGSAHAPISAMAERKRRGLPNAYTHNWNPLACLLSRPWFRRLWIVQEAALAREATMFAGNTQLSWHQLATLTPRIESAGAVVYVTQRLDVGTRLDVSRSLRNCSTIGLIASRRQKMTLCDCILATANFVCTDERDYIYALLSLPITPQAVIIPRYDASIAEVFRHFVIEEMTYTRSLKLLAMEPPTAPLEQSLLDKLSMPSWVPDMRPDRPRPLVDQSFRPQLFNAGGASRPAFEFSPDGLILQCEGFCFDTVQGTAPTMLELYAEMSPEVLTSNTVDARKDENVIMACKSRWLGACLQLATTSLQDHVSLTELSATFARAMMCSMTATGEEVSSQLCDVFPAYLKLHGLQAGGADQASTASRESLKPAMYEIEQALAHRGMPRRFCATRQGRIGQLPIVTEAGDTICILTGAEIPFVIRPTQAGRYQLIGGCYVDGVMRGELWREGFHPSEQIRIE